VYSSELAAGVKPNFPFSENSSLLFSSKKPFQIH
jgi:hypothetical protein